MAGDRRDPSEKLRDLRVQHAAIAELGLFALREPSKERVFQEAARLVRQAVGCEFSKVLEVQPDGDLLLTAGEGWPEGAVGQLELPGGGESQASYALLTGVPVIVEDLSQEARFEPSEIFLEMGIRSGINVMIPGVERAHGVLEVDSREPRRFNADEVDFLQSAANVMGTAIDREMRDREQQQFFDAVAHELRTPLAAVLGFSGRLMRKIERGGSLNEDALEELTAVYDGARRMQRSMNMLFQVSQLGRQGTLQEEPIALPRLLQHLVQETHRTFPAVEFEEHYPEELPIVEADEAAARTALGNIIENAAKYSLHEPRVTLTVVQDGVGQDDAGRDGAGEDERGITIRIRDACGGLASDELERMFDQYYRGGPDRGPRGLGLGLYLAQRICSQLGWTIDVENHPGEGCEFRVGIPATAVHQLDE